MKLERISENQIRCTLYKADLAEKELLISELAYGTDKAKELFRELMQQASSELGFEVDNIPLMIEAIPVSKECLVLIITKVEDPDELDTRFSRFTKPIEIEDVDSDEDEDDMKLEAEEDEDMPQASVPNPVKSVTDGLVEALGSLAAGLGALESTRMKKQPSAVKQTPEHESFRIFAFKSLDQVILSSKLVVPAYKSENTLYKNPQDSKFYLYMTKTENTESEFVRACNTISEYGSKVRTIYATPSHMEEHFKVIVEGNALQTLSKL